MCEPVTIMATLAVISTAAAYYGQEQASKEQYDFAKASTEEGAANARASFDLQNMVESQRLGQEEEASSQAAQANQAQAAKAKAAARVAAGEAGVAGVSVDALLSDFDRQESAEAYNIERNLEMARAQSGINRRGFAAQGRNHLSGLRHAPIKRPSAFNAGLSIAGAGMSSYARYN